MVEEVSVLRRKPQVVFLFIIAAALPATAAKRTIKAAALPASASATLALRRRFFFASTKAKCFRRAQIHHEKLGSPAVVSRDYRVSRIGCGIKCSQSSGDNSRFGDVCRKSRTFGEKRVAVSVGASRNVKRHTRSKRNKPTETKSHWRVEISADDKAMPDVERCSPILAAQIVRVCREHARRVCIAYGATESVVGKDRNALMEI